MTTMTASGSCSRCRDSRRTRMSSRSTPCSAGRWRKPGTFAYSNSGYDLLGCVIERVSGQSYRDFFAKRVFGPLGMRDTFSLPAKLGGARIATGYEKERGRLAAQSASPLDGICGIRLVLCDGRGPLPLRGRARVEPAGDRRDDARGFQERHRSQRQTDRLRLRLGTRGRLRRTQRRLDRVRFAHPPLPRRAAEHLRAVEQSGASRRARSLPRRRGCFGPHPEPRPVRRESEGWRQDGDLGAWFETAARSSP